MLPQMIPISPSSTSAIANVSSTDDDMCAPRIRRTASTYSDPADANISGVVTTMDNSGSMSAALHSE